MRRDLTEIAHELGLNLDTLNRWIRQGKIPVNKQGDFGIYSESELNRWAERQRKAPISIDDEQDLRKEQKNNDKDAASSVLSNALKRGGVFYNIAGKTKYDVIKSVVDVIPDFSGINRDEIFSQLMEREHLASTGIGKGVAIPHPRNPLRNGPANPMITSCFLADKVEFDAIDDKPVSILFVILSPTVESHLNLLSRISFCLRDRNFIDFIHQIPDTELFLNRIQEMENSISEF